MARTCSSIVPYRCIRLDSRVWSTMPWYQTCSCSLSGFGLRGTIRGGASVPPVATALTRMPSCACSKARLAVSAFTPPLAAEYGIRWMPRVATEEMLTIAPLFCAIMLGSTARQHHRVGNSERRISASICSTSYSW